MTALLPDPLVARLRAAGCVWAEQEAVVLRSSARSEDELLRLTERRCAGEPLEYVVGWAEIFGIRVVVRPGVFIPRLRSELLIRAAAELASPGDVVVDLACGTGALGAAVATLVPGIELHATDLSPAAVACARENLTAFAAEVHEGDLFGALPDGLRGSIDVVVANVPYVPTAALVTLPAEARDHEPASTLDGGPDGLELARRVLADAAEWLAPGGHVLIEATAEQAQALVAWAEHHALAAEVRRDDELDACVVITTS